MVQLYSSKKYGINAKHRLGGSKLEENEDSFLHLAVKYKRREFFIYLINDWHISNFIKDEIKCKQFLSKFSFKR